MHHGAQQLHHGEPEALLFYFLASENTRLSRRLLFARERNGCPLLPRFRTAHLAPIPVTLNYFTSDFDTAFCTFDDFVSTRPLTSSKRRHWRRGISFPSIAAARFQIQIQSAGDTFTTCRFHFWCFAFASFLFFHDGTIFGQRTSIHIPHFFSFFLFCFFIIIPRDRDKTKHWGDWEFQEQTKTDSNWYTAHGWALGGKHWFCAGYILSYREVVRPAAVAGHSPGRSLSTCRVREQLMAFQASFKV